MIRRFVSTLFVLLAFARTARADVESVPDRIVLGFNPAENAQALQTSADALARALSDRLHIPVQAYVTLDYTALVEAMRSGQVTVGWLTPSPMVLAEQLFGARVVLTQVRHGLPTYYAALVVRDDSPVHSIGDLRGRTIAWVDPQSTSGYVIPRFMLVERGIDPATFFRAQVFAGAHDSAVFAVQNGQVDAASVWADPPDEHTGAWTRYTRGRPGHALRPIAYSPPVPSDAIAVHPDFAREHPRLIQALSTQLIALGQSDEGRAILRRLNGTDGFVPADPRAYDLVRRAFRSTRTEVRATTFEHPVSVALFALLVVLAGALVVPQWSRVPRARTALAWTVFVTSVAWSFATAGLSLAPLFRGRGAIVSFLRAMVPPDRGVVPSVIESSIVTVQLALVGTVLAVPFALVLGLLAADNVMPSPTVRSVVRFALNLNRSVDTLILALVLVSAVGLGPLPGVVALAVHSVGALAKLFYEALETLDAGPPEAMRAVGASPLRVIRWGIWPQFAPHFVSIVLFRFELNVRVSTVLGLVGAGGVGFLLLTYMRGAEYTKVSVVILAIVVVVMALDQVSTRLRKRVQ